MKNSRYMSPLALAPCFFNFWKIVFFGTPIGSKQKCWGFFAHPLVLKKTKVFNPLKHWEIKKIYVLIFLKTNVLIVQKSLNTSRISVHTSNMSIWGKIGWRATFVRRLFEEILILTGTWQATHSRRPSSATNAMQSLLVIGHNRGTLILCMLSEHLSAISVRKSSQTRIPLISIQLQIL